MLLYMADGVPHRFGTLLYLMVGLLLVVSHSFKPLDCATFVCLSKSYHEFCSDVNTGYTSLALCARSAARNFASACGFK
jgi:hypothetical protein